MNVAVDTETERTLVIPMPPDATLDDELLEQVAAGCDGGGFCLEHGTFAYRPDGPGGTILLKTP